MRWLAGLVLACTLWAAEPQAVIQDEGAKQEAVEQTPEPITAEEKLSIVRLQRDGERAVAAVQKALADSNKAKADANQAKADEKQAEIDRMNAQAALNTTNAEIDRLTLDLHESYGAPMAKWRLTPELEWERKAPVELKK